MAALTRSSSKIPEADIGVSRRSSIKLSPVSILDREIAFHMTAPSGPLIFKGDKGRLLIDNVLKYTGPGGRVLVSVEDELSHIKVSVADSRIGIEEHDLPHIFDRFYSADRSRSTCGNGLGLSLAHAFVKAHRGHIVVESSPDQGSTFHIVLPR